MRSCEVLRNILNEEKKIVGEKVLAPVLPGGKIRVKIDHLVWESPLEKPFNGWGVFEILESGKARFLREAEEWEKEKYFSGFPKFSFVLFFQDKRGTWWGKSQEKFASLYLVEGFLVFDRVIALFDGANYWCVSSDPAGDFKKARAMRASLGNSIQPEQVKIANMSISEKELYEHIFILNHGKQAPVEMRRVRKALEMGGAKFLEFADVQDGFRVKWQKGKRTLVSVVDRNLSVVSAGVCLSGKDRAQDLTSLASLMK